MYSEIGNLAQGHALAQHATMQKNLSNPDLANDPAAVAAFNVEMYTASTNYQLSVRAIQDIHRENQLLSEVLRDA